jgi:hypothetical protein
MFIFKISYGNNCQYYYKLFMGAFRVLHCSCALLLWLLWWVKNLIWHVSERRKETGVACDVFVI